MNCLENTKTPIKTFEEIIEDLVSDHLYSALAGLEMAKEYKNYIKKGKDHWDDNDIATGEVEKQLEYMMGEMQIAMVLMEGLERYKTYMLGRDNRGMNFRVKKQ